MSLTVGTLMQVTIADISNAQTYLLLVSIPFCYSLSVIEVSNLVGCLRVWRCIRSVVLGALSIRGSLPIVIPA